VPCIESGVSVPPHAFQTRADADGRSSDSRVVRCFGGLAGLCVVLSLAGCGTSTVPSGEVVRRAATPTPSATPSANASLPRGDRAVGQAGIGLSAPRSVRTPADLRRQAAERLVAANPDAVYMGEVPAILLAIPVLEVELHADGQVKRIKVVRYPGQAEDTVDVAMAAVRRAAPFGDVSRMPKPWIFTETFLFNDDRKFKPRTLDE